MLLFIIFYSWQIYHLNNGKFSVVHRLGVTKMVVILNVFRVPMRFFIFKYLVISSSCAKNFKFVQGGHLWQFSTN